LENLNIIKTIAGCLNGNQNAYKELFKAYLPLAKKICRPYADTYEDMEELIDDTFLKTFKNLQKYDTGRPFSAWFRTIAVNTCINYYRSKNKIAFDSVDDLTLQIADENIILNEYNYEDIINLLAKINVNHRTIFLLFVMEGYSHKEIAETLNINEITSRTSLNKAKVALQKLISQQQKKNER
jgi:RNA polymerase sigma-70 factor, ECF subfamily